MSSLPGETFDASNTEKQDKPRDIPLSRYSLSTLSCYYINECSGESLQTAKADEADEQNRGKVEEEHNINWVATTACLLRNFHQSLTTQDNNPTQLFSISNPSSLSKAPREQVSSESVLFRNNRVFEIPCHPIDDVINTTTNSMEKLEDENPVRDHLSRSLQSDLGGKKTGSGNRQKRKGAVKNKRDFRCKFCSKSFSFFCHLQMHERVHTKEKPYRCKICSKRFTQMGSLTVHHRIHSGDMPYSCGVCSKRFRHVNSLNRHLRILHAGSKSTKRTNSGKQLKIKKKNTQTIKTSRKLEKRMDAIRKNCEKTTRNNAVSNTSQEPLQTIGSVNTDERLFAKELQKNLEKAMQVEASKTNQDESNSFKICIFKSIQSLLNQPTFNQPTSSVFTEANKILMKKNNLGSSKTNKNNVGNDPVSPIPSGNLESHHNNEPAASEHLKIRAMSASTLTTSTDTYRFNCFSTSDNQILFDKLCSTGTAC